MLYSRKENVLSQGTILKETSLKLLNLKALGLSIEL